MESRFDILAVLGGGIERVYNRKGEFLGWRPTAYIVKSKGDGVTLSAVRSSERSPDDPDCFVAGGNSRVIAALELVKHFGFPRFILFAYGARAKYLRELGGPLEGDIMKAEFLRRLKAGGYTVPRGTLVLGGIDSDDPKYLPSNTWKELENIFTLMIERNLKSLCLITSYFHMARTKVFAKAILARNQIYGLCGLRFDGIEFLEAELLLFLRSLRYGPIVLSVMESRAYARTVAMEKKGVKDFREGRYNSPRG